MELVFSCLFEDKPQSYRSWNALCPCKIDYVHLSITLLPLASPISSSYLVKDVQLANVDCTGSFFILTSAWCACLGQGSLSKKLSSGFSPCNSVENRRGLPSLLTGRKSLRFCDLKFLLKKFLALFLAFKIWERERFSPFVLFACVSLPSDECRSWLMAVKPGLDALYLQLADNSGLFQIGWFADAQMPSTN